MKTQKKIQREKIGIKRIEPKYSYGISDQKIFISERKKQLQTLFEL